jgi:hypothetical protein
MGKSFSPLHLANSFLENILPIIFQPKHEKSQPGIAGTKQVIQVEKIRISKSEFLKFKFPKLFFVLNPALAGEFGHLRLFRISGFVLRKGSQ